MIHRRRSRGAPSRAKLTNNGQQARTARHDPRDHRLPSRQQSGGSAKAPSPTGMGRHPGHALARPARAEIGPRPHAGGREIRRDGWNHRGKPRRPRYAPAAALSSPRWCQRDARAPNGPWRGATHCRRAGWGRLVGHPRDRRGRRYHTDHLQVGRSPGPRHAAAQIDGWRALTKY